MPTIIYYLRYSVDENEPCNFRDLIECNIGQLTDEDMIKIMSLKIGETYQNGFHYANVKRLEDRIYSDDF